MKKIKMNAAKLQLNREHILALNTAGKVKGGEPIFSVGSYCRYVCVNTANAGWCVPETDQSMFPPKDDWAVASVETKC